jgi:hypothetical protein
MGGSDAPRDHQIALVNPLIARVRVCCSTPAVHPGYPVFESYAIPKTHLAEHAMAESATHFRSSMAVNQL